MKYWFINVGQSSVHKYKAKAGKAHTALFRFGHTIDDLFVINGPFCQIRIRRVSKKDFDTSTRELIR